MEMPDLLDQSNKMTKRFNCDKCPYTVDNPAHFRFHVKAVHDKIKDNTCGQCDFASASKYRLQYHIATVHDKIHKFKCELCPLLKFTSLSGLRVHVKAAHVMAIVKCDSCDYKARTKSNLKAHQKAIHEKLKHRCDRCSFETPYKGNLTVHKNAVHGELMRYKCEHCKYVSGTKVSVENQTRAIHDKKRFTGARLVTSPPHINIISSTTKKQFMRR